MNRSTEVFLADIVQWARIPGIACAISSATDEVQYWCAGHHSLRETARDVSRETIFDLASLTKVLTTHQWLLTLVSDKRLDLETRNKFSITSCCMQTDLEVEAFLSDI